MGTDGVFARDKGRCRSRGYIVGTIHTRKSLEYWMPRREFTIYWHCAPRSVTLSDPVNAVITSLKAEDPVDLDLQDARHLVMAAWSETFPCITF